MTVGRWVVVDQISLRARMQEGYPDCGTDSGRTRDLTGGRLWATRSCAVVRGAWWWYSQLHPDQLVPVLLQQQLQQWGLSSGLPDWGRKGKDT
jgi:hypothetical protein